MWSRNNEMSTTSDDENEDVMLLHKASKRLYSESKFRLYSESKLNPFYWMYWIFYGIPLFCARYFARLLRKMILGTNLKEDINASDVARINSVFVCVVCLLLAICFRIYEVVVTDNNHITPLAKLVLRIIASIALLYGFLREYQRYLKTKNKVHSEATSGSKWNENKSFMTLLVLQAILSCFPDM